MRTVQRELKRIGKNYRTPKRRIRLTNFHRDKRDIIIRENLNLNDTIENGTYDDEKSWALGEPSNTMRWFAEGDEGSDIRRVPELTIPYSWSYIGRNVKGPLIFIKGKLTSIGYIHLIRTHLKPIFSRT